MGIFHFILGIVTCIIFYKISATFLLMLSIINVVGILWSWGIMHNYATEEAKKRNNYKGGFYDFTSKEIDAIPDWLVWINMATSLMGIVLFIISTIIIILNYLTNA